MKSKTIWNSINYKLDPHQTKRAAAKATSRRTVSRPPIRGRRASSYESCGKVRKKLPEAPKISA
jgi:hypothetical protein